MIISGLAPVFNQIAPIDCLVFEHQQLFFEFPTGLLEDHRFICLQLPFLIVGQISVFVWLLDPIVHLFILLSGSATGKGTLSEEFLVVVFD